MNHKNTLWADLKVGDRAEIKRLCRLDDFYAFAQISGNHNPMHIAEADGDGDGTPEAIAPSMWVASLISAVLGNVLPGPGTLYEMQNIRFLGRAQAGETLTIIVEVTEKRADRKVTLATTVQNESGAAIIEGEAVVVAPERAVTYDDSHIPGLTINRHVHFDRMIKAAEDLAPLNTAVVSPESEDALEGALLAAERGLIHPTLIGRARKIEAIARSLDSDLSPFEIIDIADHAQAARRACALVHEGRAEAVMKGHLHTDVLLGAVVQRDGGLRTKRRLSHVFVMDVPGIDHLLFITDAAINIAPDLETKADILQNAIKLAQALGIDTPLAGILSAVETVNMKIPSSVDAAILSKMAEREQIKGAVVDGPLAMDNALSLEAAQTKGLTSNVAGRADILLAPNLESGNMIAKQLTYAAHAEAAGIVMGAQVPIILTSRADDEMARLASCAVALHVRRAREDKNE